MKRFILLLRQLASEFDAFGDSGRRPRHIRGAGNHPAAAEAAGAGDRAAHGHRRHLPQGREPRPSRARSGSAASRDAGVVADAGCGSTNATGQPALARGHEALRRHQTDSPDASTSRGPDTSSARSSDCGRRAPAPLGTEWSAYSEPFVIAPWYEGSGAPPVQIALPDVTDRNLLRSLKPNVAFELPPALQNLLLGKSEGPARRKDPRAAARSRLAGSAASACRSSRSAPSSA